MYLIDNYGEISNIADDEISDGFAGDKQLLKAMAIYVKENDYAPIKIALAMKEWCTTEKGVRLFKFIMMGKNYLIPLLPYLYKAHEDSEALALSVYFYREYNDMDNKVHKKLTVSTENYHRKFANLIGVPYDSIKDSLYASTKGNKYYRDLCYNKVQELGIRAITRGN